MLELRNISKNFKDFSLKNLNFKVEKNEYFVILGESGAGKTIILEIIAGLKKQDSGQIFYQGKDISNETIQKRKFGLLFQDYAVFPHLSVKENISYPLKKRKLKKIEIDNKVKVLASEMDILQLLNRRPATLSGGELQRVAMARTLASDPEILLLDEPLTSLDVQLKFEIRSLLRKINQKGITIIHITHDYEEAITLAHKIAIIQNGTIIQSGTPQEVFKNPKSKFVANLTGIKNFFKVQITEHPDKKIKLAQINESLSFKIHSGIKEKEGFIFLSNKNILISNSKLSSSALNNFKATILDIFPAKLGYEIIADIGVKISIKVSEESLKDLKLEIGKSIWLTFKASSLRFLKK